MNAALPVSPTSAVPLKQLLTLTAAVAVAHLLFLTGTASLMQPEPRNVNRPFSTRSITINAPQPPPAIQPAAAATAVAPRPPTPRPTNPAQNNINSGLPPTALSNGSVAPAESDSIASVSIADSNPEPVAAIAPERVASSAATADEAVNSAPVTASVNAPVAPTVSAPPGNAVAFAIPGSKRLKYNVIGTKDALTYHARAELLWLQDGSTYDARLEVSAFLVGSRVRTSTGRLSADGLLPNRFADKFRTEVAAHFERDKGTITFSANTPSLPITPGLQDQLSVFIQFGAMLGGAREKYPEGTELTFETIGPRSGETWVITVGGEEKLTLPGGAMDAIKLTRKPRRDYDQTAELWLAPSLGYLPARIKITDRNGDYVDQQWRTSENP